MKKAALIIAAILLVAGLVIAFIAFASSGCDFRKFETTPSEVHQYPVEGSFRSIEIHGDTEDIRFVRSDDGTARVECRETKKTTHTVTVENDTLKISSRQANNWKDIFEISFETELIVVYLPNDAYEMLSIETSTGDAEVPDWLTFMGGAAIKASTADIRFDAAVDHMLTIKTSTGSISVNGASAEAIDCTVTTGDIMMTGVACRGDVRAKVSTGRVILIGLNCHNFITEGSTGSVTLRDVLASEMISIKRSTGDVHFTDCDAAQIAVTTSTGDVTGTLRTGKTFRAHSSTGDISVPDSVPDGRCEITTTTGDIEIRIAPAN